MKKAKPVYLLFILSLLMYGCLAEDRDDCIDQNLVLHFEYRDGENRERLTETIETIDLLLFDARRCYHRWVPVAVQDLEEGNTLTMTLEPGDYHIVAWGNYYCAGGSLSGLLPGDELQNAYAPFNAEESIDPLFYAPDLRGMPTPSNIPDERYCFTVAPGQMNRHTISFMPAHHRVNVYLRNFPDVASPALPMPAVSLSGFADGYNFLLTCGTSECGLQQRVKPYTAPDSPLPHGLAAFNVPHFQNDDPITIDIKGTAGASDYSRSLSMKQVLEELQIEVADGANQTINILLIYDGVNVHISQPEWITQDVGGGIDN